MSKSLCLIVLCLPVLAWGQEVSLTPDHTNGVYRAGERAVFRLAVAGPAQAKAHVTLKAGGWKVVQESDVELDDGAAEVAAPLPQAGTLLAEAKVKAADGKTVRALAGVVAAPEEIAPAVPAPADFDAFWKAKVAELQQVPMNAVLEKGDSGRKDIEYFKVTMDNIRGTRIRGQLARPAAGGKLPALLVVQWAGVYPLDKGFAVWPAGEGYLVLNLNAHDLPIDEAKEFYQKQNDGPLKDYPAIGNDDRETSYFLRMYLSAYRGADYLASRPDWNGKTLIVSGTSQGGLQTIMLCGLHPKITAGLANVPAGCDWCGADVGRAPGWPMWNSKAAGKDPARVRAAGGYYDVVNFAARIHCPMLVAIGLIDETCPPAGVLAACHEMKGPKEILLMPRSDHQGKGNAQAAYFSRSTAWRQALRHGQPVPP